MVIHPTGAADLEHFSSALHQRLRGLGYRRFVLQFVRHADEQTLSAPVYSRLAPSPWQVSESARKLWGLGAGDLSVLDEDGELLEHRPGPPRDSALAASREWARTPLSVAIPEDPAIAAQARMRAMDADAIGHRLRSLAHHWLYLLDRNDGNAAPLDELFADGFELAWSPAGIRTREDLAAWYHGVSTRLLKSSHSIGSFEYERRDDGRFAVRLELQWYGFTRERPDEELEASTLHEWTVVDDPSERFARIEAAKIKVQMPAQARRR